ncbi:hypothetical protein BH23GEM11_BH23GEM11_16940 [soil metagenome]
MENAVTRRARFVLAAVLVLGSGLSPDLAPFQAPSSFLSPHPLGAQAVQTGDRPAARARLPSPLPISRLASPILLDGVVEELAWEVIEPLPLTMFAPTFGAPMSERTEIRIAHDDQYLYVSGRMFDSDPDGIRTNTFYRDQYSGDDLLAVVIDSYNDFGTAVWFTTNPAGTRGDRSVSNDGVFAGGGSVMNMDWNAHWDVETSQTEEGWFAEFRIPLSTLGFQVVDDQVTMGLIVYRFIARKNERQIFPAIDPRWGGLAFAKPSQAHRILLEGVQAARPVYLTPYLLTGVRQTPAWELAAGAPVDPGSVGSGRWGTASTGTAEAGFDLRFSPSSNLSLDMTVNTDFAQVEADDQQINLTRFPLFFPEKRQFFQERSSTFQFGTGRGSDRLFHSRRIGLVDGEIARIYGGGRAVGRIGGTDFGVLTLQTSSPGGHSSENAAVVRVSQQVLNQFSSVGGMLTSRLGPEGRENWAMGVDATLRPLGDEWVNVRAARTFDGGFDEASSLEASLLRGRWERIRDDGFSYAGEVVRVGRDYRPGLGFQARRDVHSLYGRVQVKRFLAVESPLRAATFRVDTEHFYRNRRGGASSRSVVPEISAEFKGGSEIKFTGTTSFENILVPFAIGEVAIQPGSYWFHSGELSLQRSRSSLLRGSLTGSAGTFYDGSRLGLAVDPTWTQSRYLEVGGGYQLNQLRFADRNEVATAHLVRLRGQVALSTRISFSLLAQYSNLADLGTLNARFRYHFREGTDLWVVLNEGRNLDRDPLSTPPLPGLAGRTLLVKYSRTLVR